MQDLYLQHHGIKGQRWGVRRFQKKDGSLTPAGKKRYSAKTQAKYDKYYEKYKTLGYDDEKAHKAARGRVIANRATKVMVGTAAVAATGYVGYRYYDSHKDRFVAPGKLMQTVHTGDAAERLTPGNPFYATYGKKDNTIYSSKVFSHFNKDSNVTKFMTDNGIKIASEGTGRKIFDELKASNPEVAAYAERVRAGGKSKKAYLNFNYSLVLRNDSETARRMGLEDLDHDKVHKIFYDELKKRGYGAIIDSNDAKREGFTFTPLIVFDNQTKHIASSTKATVEQLGTARTMKGLQYSTMRKTLLQPWNNPAVVGTGYAFLSSTGYQVGVNKDLDRRVEFVEQYRREHPNTKLSNAKIAEMYET